jgi:Ca-activated chloride channel homolog
MNWWANISFVYPWAFWFLLLIPACVAIYISVLLRRRPVVSLSSMRFLQGLPTPPRARLRHIPFALKMLALALVITALARPQSKLGWKRIRKDGIDIMISMDVSPSMDAKDFKPNRLEAAKKTAINFVNTRFNDRIGMVIFSGETFTLCPLTADHSALGGMIDSIQIGELNSGTAIGLGLAKAVERLKDSKAKSRVIVLLTDGENNSGFISPLDAGRLAKTYNIKVYSIGVGGYGKTLQPQSRNPDGSWTNTYRETDIDEETLIEISKETGGKYFRAVDLKSLEAIYEEIDRLEKSAIEGKQSEQRKEDFLPLLIAAIALLLIESTLRYTVFNRVE